VPTRQTSDLRAIRGRPPRDRSKEKDYHKPGRDKGRKRTGHKMTKWERRDIVAWDGEGFTREALEGQETGVHVYNLLANSRQTYIVNHDGLDTESIFRFLLHESDPNAINVIYGGSYDVNMWLKDVPRPLLVALWTDGVCFWHSYKISYAHRKKFTIQAVHYKGSGGSRQDRSFTLWDVLGYFQATFVEACTKWLGDLPLLQDIQKMKLQRSSFTEAQFDEVVTYNRTECLLLVDLMNNLFSAMDEASIQLTRYDGAGSIAAYLLRVNGIKEHMGETPIDVQRWAQWAYSGGRIEAPKVGTFVGPMYRRDINSAYPSAAIDLPSMNGMRWELENTWNGSPYSIVKVHWYYRKEAPFYPLWYRESNGTILYPRLGSGAYYGVEIQSLYDYYEEGKDFYIDEAYNCYTPDKIERPFAFLQRTYDIRLIFKRRGSMASEALKLGINSVYGKLAQQAGARNGRVPAYHNLIWAGLITATTRRTMYMSAMQSPSTVVAFATDAIITTNDVPDSLPIGSGLGEWTVDEFDGITIVQPGVYWLLKGSDWQAKYRGFDKGTLQRDTVIETWKRWDQGEACWCNTEEECDHIHAKLTRFIALGGALARREDDFYNHWTRWEAMDRKLTITPSGKRYAGEDTCFYDHLCDTIAQEPFDPAAMSQRYPITWLDGPEVLRPTEEGVDIRIIEEEELDSYA
jgi:hypothetical protein